jgi:glycine betaine/proline transport system substrate-binding protein
MTKTARKRTGLVALLGAGMMVMAACGGSVNEAAEAPAAPDETTAEETVVEEGSALPDCGEWGIAMHNWVGYTATAEVLAQVAETELGCSIDRVQLEEAGVTYDAMEAGSVDVIVEDWGGGRWSDWVDRGALAEVGTNGIVGSIGMYVPAWMAEEYPDITDGTKLNEYVDLFKTPESGNQGAWYEGPPGYTTIGEKIIDAYGLDYRAINAGSEPALLELLETGQKDRKPVLAYFWEPHFMHADVPLARVNFPANDWSDTAEASGKTDYPADELFKIATTNLTNSGSPFAVLLANFNMTNADQNSIALDIEGGMSPAEAAQKWIANNSDKVQSWLQGL